MSKASTIHSTDSRSGFYFSIAADNHSDFCAKLQQAADAFLPFHPAGDRNAVRSAINGYVGRHSLAQGRALVQMICGDDVLSLSQIPPAKYVQVAAACQAGAAVH